VGAPAPATTQANGAPLQQVSVRGGGSVCTGGRSGIDAPQVVGIDLVNIQPQRYVAAVRPSAPGRADRRSIPPNLRFRVHRDYEAPNWSLGESSWDLIHLRFGCGGVSEWPEMYQKIFLCVVAARRPPPADRGAGT
jgi:hypothetical protein